jgi:hypothetical protein
MKKAHKAAMHHSIESLKHSHEYDMAGGHGSSGHEGAPMGLGEFANMPQGVHMSIYPKPAHKGNGFLDDTISHVDQVNHAAEAKEGKYMSYQH